MYSSDDDEDTNENKDKRITRIIHFNSRENV
jgi:hypothetical protein